MSRQNKMFYQTERRFLMPLVASLVIGNVMPLSSLAIVIDAPAKKGNLQLDGYARLTSGAGPSTNDVSNNPVESNSSGESDAKAGSDLQPLTLSGDSSPGGQNGDTSTAGDGVLKSSVRETVVAPHEANEQVLEEASVAPANSGSKGGKHRHGKVPKTLVEQGKDVAVGPLPLLTTEKDDKNAAEFINTAEKEQISDLWESTLARSPDIQFVIQKLQPTSNQAHLNSVLTKLLGAAMYGGMGATMMMMPNAGMGGYAMMSGGSSAISSVLGIAQKRADNKAKLSQEEQMMMLQIVRNTADKLVGSYRDYKKFFVSLARASNDLQDLQAMAAEARAGQDASKQLEMDYTLRKAQRDVDQISDDVRRNRSNLIDLAGGEAVAKLDKQIIWEQTQVDQGPVDQGANAPGPVADSVTKVGDEAKANPVAESTPNAVDDPSAQSGSSGQAQNAEVIDTKNPKTASNNPSPQS